MTFADTVKNLSRTRDAVWLNCPPSLHIDVFAEYSDFTAKIRNEILLTFELRAVDPHDLALSVYVYAATRFSAGSLQYGF
eukprot:4574360-Pleurochrysis_carterae.AAC.3